MTHHYCDYFWKEGIPYGIAAVDPSTINEPTYKIVMDPYRKHISIEQYQKNVFQKMVYDSAFLNFRHLKNEDHRAWQKITVSETEEKIVCHLRDQDDRLVFEEIYFFKQDFCYECHAISPHGILISIQRMLYKKLHDPCNGVILFDSNDHPVVFKEYEFDEDAHTFTDLIVAKWNMQNFKVLVTCLQ